MPCSFLCHSFASYQQHLLKLTYASKSSHLFHLVFCMSLRTLFVHSYNAYKLYLMICYILCIFLRLPRWLRGKESIYKCWSHRRPGVDPWVGKIPWRRKWQPTPVFLPGKSHRQRSLVVCKESDMIEHMHMHLLGDCISLILLFII